eukprot:2633218-Amphidinium_carterae.1
MDNLNGCVGNPTSATAFKVKPPRPPKEIELIELTQLSARQGRWQARRSRVSGFDHLVDGHVFRFGVPVTSDNYSPTKTYYSNISQNDKHCNCNS